MTSKTILLGLVAVTFVAGSIMTGTMAEAKKDDKGNPFQAVLDAIQNAITPVQSDITMIKSDVGDIKTETDKIQMIKDTISSNVIPEPLNQLKILAIGGDSPIDIVDVVSTGPMIVDVCVRVFHGFLGEGNSFVIVKNEVDESNPNLTASINVSTNNFSTGTGTQCVTMVAEPSQTISVLTGEIAGGSITGYINMHTTTSATLTITDLTP